MKSVRNDGSLSLPCLMNVMVRYLQAVVTLWLVALAFLTTFSCSYGVCPHMYVPSSLLDVLLVRQSQKTFERFCVQAR